MNSRLTLVHSSPDDARRQRRAFLALCTIQGWGYWTLKDLSSKRVNFDELLHLDDTALHDRLRELAVRTPSAHRPWSAIAEGAWAEAAALQNRLAAAGVELVLRGTSRYPASLEDLPDPPEWLFVRGNLDALTAPSIAIVGTRDPSSDGLWLAGWLADALQLLSPSATVSGLAAGIDQAIHRGSITAGVPTVAVLGTGIFTEFPQGSAPLADEIVRLGGAVVTEYLPMDRYSKDSFVRRNRIQAALARVVIPVEWKVASGTAHTIRYAEDLGRPLVALHRRTRPSDTPELLDLRRRGGRVFTVVGEEPDFIAFVRHHLTRDPTPAPAPPSAPVQLKLV